MASLKFCPQSLGHELGHIFQLRFSPAGAVRNLYRSDTELIANVIGRETEEKNNKAICKQLGVDEYQNFGSAFRFKYKGTTGSIHRQNLSEEEKFQIIQRVKNYGLDEYKDLGSEFTFKYKNTTGSIHRQNLSEEEKFQIIQRVKDYELDKYVDRGSVFEFKYKGTTGSIHRQNLSEEEKFQIIQRIKNYGLDGYEDSGSRFEFKYKNTTGCIYYKNLSGEEKFQIIQHVKDSGLDEYKDFESRFEFKYKNTTGSIRYKNLSEEKKFQIIQHVKDSGLDEYKDFESRFEFKYKNTTGSICYKNLSEEEKFQIIQRVKDSKLDEYWDYGWGLEFKYKGASFSIYCKNPSEEGKFQIIQDIKSSYKSLTSKCDGLGNDSTTLSIRLDEKNNIDSIYFDNRNKNIHKRLDKTLISRSKPEEEVNEVQHTDTGEPTERQPVLPSPKMINVGRSKPEEEVNEVQHIGTGEPAKHQPVLPNSKIINIEGTNFKLKVHYDQIDKKDLLMIEKYVNYIFHAYKEKHALDVNANTILESYIYNNLEDYHNAHPWTRGKAGGHAQGLNQYVPHKGSHFIGELLAHEICHSLNHYNQQNHGIPRPSCGHAGHDDASHFGWDLRKELDAIKLGNSQKESNTGKSQESNEVNSGSEKEKPQSQGELNKVEHTGSKEEQSKVEESQQDSSNLLPNVIFQTLDYIIGSISSFFSWLFGSKEKEQPAQQSDDNLSLLKFDVSELDHDVGNHSSDNHNHYHSSDELI